MPLTGCEKVAVLCAHSGDGQKMMRQREAGGTVNKSEHRTFLLTVAYEKNQENTRKTFRYPDDFNPLILNNVKKIELYQIEC